MFILINNCYYVKLIHVGCVVHGLHNLTKGIPALFKNLNTLIIGVNNVFRFDKKRKLIFDSFCENNVFLCKHSPEPNEIRFGYWITAAEYYTNLTSLHVLKSTLKLIRNVEFDDNAIEKARKIDGYEVTQTFIDLIQLCENLETSTDALTVGSHFKFIQSPYGNWKPVT